MVIPVGESRMTQSLIKLAKQEDGSLKKIDLGGCRFVDLIGSHGWSEEGNGNRRR